MKIQRPNQTHLNIYNNQMKSQLQKLESVKKQDRIQISNVAKQLQHDIKMSKNRANYVENLKNKVETGQYEVDFYQTAEKMIEFWSRRS